MVNIREYLDYRRFLADILAEKRELGTAYTMRAIQKRLGINSSGHLSNLIAGRTNLSLELASKIGDIFSLSEVEKTYFKTMILFSHARTVDEKNHFFEQMLAYRRTEPKLLENDALNIFSKWYYAPIRELLNLEQTDDYAVIGRRIIPALNEKEVARSVDVLVKGGFIKKNDAGKWERCDAALSTGDDVKSFLIVRFQKEMMDLATLSLTAPLDDRDISGVTLTLSKQSIPILKEEIRNFRKRAMQIALDDAEPDRVYRCSIQLFPLTRGADNVNS